MTDQEMIQAAKTGAPRGRKILLGARHTKSKVLKLCAMGDVDFVLNTWETCPMNTRDAIDLGKHKRQHNGLYWYFVPDHILYPLIGFTQNRFVNLLFGDIHDFRDKGRMCWGLSDTGQRAGDIMNEEELQEYDRVIYISDEPDRFGS